MPMPDPAVLLTVTKAPPWPSLLPTRNRDKIKNKEIDGGTSRRACGRNNGRDPAENAETRDLCEDDDYWLQPKERSPGWGLGDDLTYDDLGLSTSAEMSGSQ